MVVRCDVKNPSRSVKRLSPYLTALAEVIGTAIAVERTIDWLDNHLPGQELSVSV